MKFYKKLFMFILLFAAICIASIPKTNYAFAASKSRGVILFSYEQSGKEIILTTKLQQNDGICSFELALNYDSSVMTLTEATNGTAFSDITYSENYSVNPYKIAWDSSSNSTSTGVLYSYKFLIKDDAPNGSYNITYSYDNESGINYYEDGNPALQKAKFSIETAVITINNGKVSVEIKETETQKTNTGLIIGLSCGGVAVLGGATFFVIKHKKQKGWKKIAK